ncbi:MAG: nuclear transport factor 2 family protein [Spirochaetales bacterium]|nr:nuclear transport factor 2 family protein [Spirochaetales bacterium]
MEAEEIVRAYWAAMETNDFKKAAGFFSEGYICRWPQSSEVIEGKENFIRINSEYPSEGRWTFIINNLVADAGRAVTDVSISDGKLKARAVTFHTIVDGLITEQLEFWPEDYEAPAWRRKWVKIDKS